jgi:hypothetical protein
MRNIEGLRIGARGKRNHVLRADRGDQFARRAKSNLFAVVHDSDALAEALGFVHVMRGEKDGPAGELELLDQIPKLAAGLRVQAGGGLIEKKKIGIADERASERETLFLAARKISDARILFFFELHEFDGFGGARPFLKKAAEQAERFEDGQLFRELGILQLNAEPLTKLPGIGIPMETKQFDVAGIGSSQAFANLDGCCFARPVWPEKAEALAGADFEVEAIDGDHVLIRLAKTADAKGCSGGRVEHESSIALRNGMFKS